MKIVFFGTPSFSAVVLEALIEAGHHIVGVISKPDKPKGRDLKLVPTPVKALIAEKYPHVPLWQPEKVSDPSFAPILQTLGADLFVVVAYGEILREHILHMPPSGCINVHTSLLPLLRGAAPIQRAIIEGHAETGVTIMYLVKKMDAGDVISQTTIPIGDDMTFGDLEQEILQRGIGDLLKVLQAFEKGAVKGEPQDHAKATLAPKVELEECEINWNRPAQELHNLVRGVNPYPGAWCWVHVKGEKKRLKIFKTATHPLSGSPGSIITWGKSGLIVGCQEGALELKEVQLEGKKRMTAEELMRGLDKTQVTL